MLISKFLYQALAGLWPAHLVSIDFVHGVRVCVCVSVCSLLGLLITSGMICSPYDWLKNFYSFYMAASVIISSGRGLRIEACHGN